MTRPVLHQGHSPHGCHQETRFFIAVAVNNAVSPVDAHFRLQKAIEANPYSDETLGLLHDGKIQFLVVSSHAAMKAVAARDRKFGLRLVFEDPQGTQILELLHQVE